MRRALAHDVDPVRNQVDVIDLRICSRNEFGRLKAFPLVIANRCVSKVVTSSAARTKAASGQVPIATRRFSGRHPQHPMQHHKISVRSRIQSFSALGKVG